jgi:hypothetical protein
MAQTIQLKRSAQSGKVPDTGSLNLGELAVNTYDGKIYFKKSGSIETVESVLTTNSVVTGSIRLEGTGSFGSLKVNDTLTVNHGEAIISGSALVTSDLTILGAVNARQFNISVISSSVLFESGSSRFGNTSDDTHQFTGSVNVTGSLYLNGVAVGGASNSGSFTGSFSGDGSGLRGVTSDDIPRDGWDYDSNSSASISDFNDVSDKYFIDFAQSQSTEVGTPVGFKGFLTNVSGSTQILPTLDGIDFVVGNNVVASIGVGGIIAQATAGTVSGSSQLTSSYDSRYVLSGSITQTTWDNIASKPSGIVSGSAQTIANLPTGIISGSSQLTSSVLATTGSNTFRGTQTLSGSIIPAIDNIYDLGSATYQWRDIYVSSGSLYIDGTKVLGSTGNELQITTDVGQSIKILEAGSDSIILQSADGNIELKSSGGGNLLFDPTTGLIDVRGTLQIQDGNKITSSGGNGIVFGNNIVVSGSIESTSTINGINLTTFSSSVSNQISTIQTKTGSFATTGSNSFIGNQNISGTIFLTGSIIPSGSFVYDIGSETNSFRDLFLSTGSIRFHNPDGTEQGRITVDARSGDISLLKTAGLTNEQKATISQGNINPDFLTSVSASNLFVQTKIVMPAGGTVNGINLTAFSSSVASTILNQNNATSSYETKGRGIVSGSSQIISLLPTGVISGSSQIVGGSGLVSGSSQITLSSTTGFTSYSSSVDSRITTEKGRVDAILLASDADKDSFAEIVSLINAVDTSNDSTFASFYTGSVNRLNNLESTSGSVNTSISNLNTFSASVESKNTTLGTYTSSLDTKFSTLGTYTGSLETKNSTLATYTGSVNSQLTNLNGVTSSYETKGRGIVSGSSQTINYLNSAAPGVVSGSSQTILNLPTGTISGSSQVNVMSTTNIARLATTGSNTFTGNITIGNATAATNVKLFLNGVASKAAGIEFQQGGTSQWYIGNGIASEDNNFELYNSNGNMAMKITKSTNAIKFIGETTIAGNVLPEANGTRDLGSSTYRWSTIYTSDLSLNNGIGDWTIVEGEDDLFLYNNKKGKVYKFALTEVEPNVATPKKS